ncbi:MAG: rhomboid family intramembrane serine protease [Planctomycetota bacterium]|nr:rhomboid family intramembrane serine protease [Planctomycetota bacterium]
MGIYDRDYGRQAYSPWEQSNAPKTITVTLIIINVFVFIVEQVTREQIRTSNGDILIDCVVIDWLAISGDTLMKPWMWWQFLTYGFAHDVSSINHLLYNMIGLFVFGRDVEYRLGRNEFLRFYLIAVVLGGIVGSVTHLLNGSAGLTIGASGAVIGTSILFACFFPNRQLLLMLVIPVKAWIMAIIFVTVDIAGALGLIRFSNTAFTVHLAGAFFALAYFRYGWNTRKLSNVAPQQWMKQFSNRSHKSLLKIHDPDRQLAKDADEADRILAKIHSEGEESLTAGERKTLERYSRLQREKRKQ